MLRRLPLLQMFRFGLVGVFNTGVDLAIWSALTRFAGMDYVVANLISYSASAALSFFINRTWTFSSRSPDQSMGRQAALFAGVTVVGIAVSSATIHLLAPYIGGFFAKVASVFFVFGVTFWLNKRVTFRA